jgi:lysophospholipase L1-like esterase
MKQLIILGASYAYGAGGQNGGWGDFLKKHLHNKMYSDSGEGDKYEVYSFAKPGATTQFILDTAPEILRHYCRNKSTTIILNIGANDAKAVNSPTNFLTTLPEFSNQLELLLDALKGFSNDIIFVSDPPFDETKTTPKVNPLDGSNSYFTNSRREELKEITKKLCREKGAYYLQIEVDRNEWINNCLFRDGLHPNQKGHQIIFDTVLTYLEKDELL